VSAFRTTRVRTVADVGFVRLDEVEIEAPDGATAERYVLRMHDAVAVVALHGEHVILVEQFRTPFETALVEIPAGVLDVDGEDPIDAVRRELEEEAGYTGGEITHLGDLIMSPGATDEVISLYLARDVEPVERRPASPEERHATVVTMTMDEALEAIGDGRIRDAKTVAALMMARA
jgi:8-oxo-dGTP pyrophosphatase MutT (NUDIX family)